MSARTPEQIAEDPAALFLLSLAGGIQRLAEVAGALARSDELRVERVVQLAGEHLLTLSDQSLLLWTG